MTHRWAPVATGLVLTTMLLAAPMQTLAADETPPQTGWDRGIFFTLQHDHNYNSGYAPQEYNFTYLLGDIHADYRFNDRWSVKSMSRLDILKNPTDKDWYFTAQGLWLDWLYADYDDGTWGAKFGKMRTQFGNLWEFERWDGLYTPNLAWDYKTDKMLGVAGSYTARLDEFGKQKATAYVLKRDNTFLSQTLLSYPNQNAVTSYLPERLHTSTGGAANTELPESFVLTLEGSDYKFAPGLHTNIAYRYLASGENKATGFTAKDTSGVAATAYYTWQINDDWKWEPMVEYVHLRDVDLGYNDNNGSRAYAQRDYWSGASFLYYGGWIWSAAYTNRGDNNLGPGVTSDDVWLLTSSLSYYWDNGWGVGAGWQRSHNSSLLDPAFKVMDTDTFGLSVMYYLPF